METISILSNIKDYPIISNGTYFYNDRAVPRVTEILSAMIHEDYLMEWANRIGLFNHQKYQDVLEKAGDIGTYTHDSIEKFLSENIPLNTDGVPRHLAYPVYFAQKSFLEWWNIIIKNDYEILMQEQELVCEYFGGKLDLLLKINGKIYLVDFKTSNHSSYKYYLQLSAYRYMLRKQFNIEIDGCIILMLDKKICKFTEMFLNFQVSEHLEYINQCENTFISLVFAYYQKLKAQQMYNNIEFGGLT